MSKSKYSVLIRLGAAAMVTVVSVSTAFGGTWQPDSVGWRYYNDGGQPAGDGWIQDGMDFYHTNGNGYMQTGWYQDLADNGRWYYLNPQQGGPQGSLKTGWLQDNGRWYFLDTRIGGPRGSMMSGWQWIDGKCYYLDPAQGGAMAADCITPDGSRVDASGAWVDADGAPHYEESKGISSTVAVDITAQSAPHKTTGSRVPGGGTSGGGGSRGGSTSGGSTSGGGASGGGSGSHSGGTIREDSAWKNYSDSSISRAANDFENGNYGRMSSGEREEMKEAIEDFKETYLTAGMSDFEKEILIIQWLVENCSYETGENWSNSTGYSCIVKGKAQCSGYADAFLQTAKACGLEARYIYNSSHAWNLVKLDDDWYHVDVTWEDPTGSNDYGFSTLRNQYINLEDSEISRVSSHMEWSPNSIKANGIAYGPKTVSQYLQDGTIDTSKGESFRDQMDQFFAGIRNEDGSNILSYTSAGTTADQICAYLEKEIDAKRDSFGFAVRYPSEYTAKVTGNYSKLLNLNSEIESSVNKRINEKYKDVLRNPIMIYLYLEQDADNNYYAYETGSLSYQEGQGKKVDYLVHFVDTEGNEVGTQSGTGEQQGSVALTFPKGYGWIGNDSENYKVSRGSVSYQGMSFRILSDGEVEIEVRLKNLNAGNSQLVRQNDEALEVLKETENTGKQQPEKASPSSADRI